MNLEQFVASGQRAQGAVDRILEAEHSVKVWNAAYPVGTAVLRYKLVHPLRDPVETRTRSTAWLMGGHTAMVMVDGIAGGVALESVKPI